MKFDNPWPKISLVTPHLNQGKYLERAIRSVLDQEYPNLEYIIVDGGSASDSLDVIRKYADKLSYWVSEKDSGQSHAINKGFNRSTGRIMGWLNADDQLERGALHHVAEHMQHDCEWLAGASVIDIEGRQKPMMRMMSGTKTRDSILPWYKNWFPQPSTFWTRELWQKAGRIDETLHYVMDYELWLRMSRYAQLKTTSKVLSRCFLHKGSKSYTKRRKVFGEMMEVMIRSAEGRERKKIPRYTVELGLKFVWDAAAGLFKLGRVE